MFEKLLETKLAKNLISEIIWLLWEYKMSTQINVQKMY